MSRYCTLDITLRSLPEMVSMRSFLFWAKVSGLMMARPTSVRFTAYSSFRPWKASACRYSRVQLAILMEATFLRPRLKKNLGPSRMGYLGPTLVTTTSVMSDPNFWVPWSSLQGFLIKELKEVPLGLEVLKDKPAASGHHVGVDIARALAESGAGHVLAEHHLLIVGQIIGGLVLLIIIIIVFLVVVLVVRVAFVINSVILGFLIGGFGLKKGNTVRN